MTEHKEKLVGMRGICNAERKSRLMIATPFMFGERSRFLIQVYSSTGMKKNTACCQ
jgi:hypothetical protein